MVGTSDVPAADEKYAKFYKFPANYSREFRVMAPPFRVVCPYDIKLFYRDFD